MSVSPEAPKLQSLSQLLQSAIYDGVPLYNAGKRKECFDLYVEAAKLACAQERVAKSKIGQILENAVDEAIQFGSNSDYREGSWVLRHCFDEILSSQSVVDDKRDLGVEYWQDEKSPNTSDF